MTTSLYDLYDRERVLYDVSNLAFVAADVRGDKHSAHALHQALDIVEAGNIDRVNGILDLASAEVEVLISSAEQSRKGMNREPLSRERVALVKAWVHEYLVAKVLADWLSITLPEAAGVWKEKATEAFNALSVARTGVRSITRRVPPI